MYKACALLLSLLLAAYAAPSSAQDYRKQCAADKKSSACGQYARELFYAERFAESEKYFKQACENGESSWSSGYEDAMACRYMAALHYYQTSQLEDGNRYCGYNAYGQKVPGSCYSTMKIVSGYEHSLVKGRKPNKKIAQQYLKKALEKSKRGCERYGSQNLPCGDYKTLKRAVETDDHSRWWTTDRKIKELEAQIDAVEKMHGVSMQTQRLRQQLHLSTLNRP